jgi:hypothetical protein
VILSKVSNCTVAVITIGELAKERDAMLLRRQGLAVHEQQIEE